MQQKWSELTKIAPLKNLLGNMEVLILVTNEQNCWKTESGKHFGLTPLWGSVILISSCQQVIYVLIHIFSDFQSKQSLQFLQSTILQILEVLQDLQIFKFCKFYRFYNI